MGNNLSANQLVSDQTYYGTSQNKELLYSLYNRACCRGLSNELGEDSQYFCDLSLTYYEKFQTNIKFDD